MPILNSPRTRHGRGKRLDIPLWVTNAPYDRWGIVPVQATLSTIDPKLNPLINPNYPGDPEWYAWTGFNGIVTAWCGACYNFTNDELWLPLSGGHADYAGNEPYKLSLNKATPTWTMVRPPSGAIGNLLTTNDGQEASGVYADGQPRSIHSANKPLWIPTLGQPWISSLGNTSWSAQAGTKNPVQIDPFTGLGTLKTPRPNSAYGGGISASCFDPSRGVLGSIWARGGGGVGHKFHRYDIATDTWTVDIGPYLTLNDYVSLTYMPEYDCILVIDSSSIRIFDCTAGTASSPNFVGTNLSVLSACQPVWINGKAYVWNNSSNTDKITKYTPTGDPRVADWSIDTLNVDIGNLVIPDVKQTNGTYGRFTYSPKLGIFIVMNTINGNIYFFKPSTV